MHKSIILCQWYKCLNKQKVQYNILIVIQQTMQQQQRLDQSKTILLQQKGKVIQKNITISGSAINILSSQIDISIVGGGNKILIQDSAGKILIRGNDNQIEIKRSWLACKLDGNQNQFTILQTQFQLISHDGYANLVPGVVENLHVAFGRRMINQRVLNMRLALKQRSENIKKLLPHLLKSIYNSETRECSICYDQIKTGDEVTSLFCFHLFHSICIQACLQTAVKCPVCSLDLLAIMNQQVKSGNFVSHKGEIVMKESMEIEPS